MFNKPAWSVREGNGLLEKIVIQLLDGEDSVKVLKSATDNTVAGQTNEECV